MIFWNAELARRLACTKREKSHLGSIIKELLEIHDTVRTEGIKSLTDSASIKEKPILSYGLRLIEEGVSGETLEEILAIYLIASLGLDSISFCSASTQKRCFPWPREIPRMYIFASWCPTAA
jgi:hypothetical protein